MLNRKFFFALLLIWTSQVFSQSVDLPRFALSGISFEVKIADLPDSIKSVTVNAVNDDYSESFEITAANGIAGSEILLENSGTYSIELLGSSHKSEIRIIPGFTSIVPPLVAILLALLIRQVLVSLAAGIYMGAFFIYDYDPVSALFRLADVFILNALIDKDHMYIVLFTLMIGGVVGVISRNGGTAGLANQITKLARTARSGMLSSWLMGIVVFFDDYANSLIIGNMMRPITDNLRISREKLAYIVDSTAAPIASIVFISTWVGYEVGLIEEGLRSIGSNENAYDLFLRTIPYGFYPIAAIFFVFLTSYMRKDFGPMYKAEKRARDTGKTFENLDGKETGKKELANFYTGEKSKWYNGAVPILIILVGTISGLVYTGIESLESQNITNYSLQDIISNSDSYSALLWSSFIASVVAIIMTVSQKIITLNETVDAWQSGIQSMMVAVIILIFAWGISAVTNELKTADYLISILSDAINPHFLPAIVFIICAVIGFSTGTSWGTMAIVMPIIIPLTHKVGMGSGISPEELRIILFVVISSVLAGSVFGDHCSPIADTTILSSLASQCNHIDHVRTQLPYALLVGTICIVLGYIPAAFGLNPFISIALIFASLFAVLFFFAKDVPRVRI